MQVPIDDRRPFVAILCALIVLAWLALWLWGQSPSGRFLNHDPAPIIAGVQVPGHDRFGQEALPTPLGHDHGPAEHSGPAVPLVVAGWTLMTTAMMLPTSLPLLALFHALTRRRRDRTLLVALVIAGFLAVWTTFGLAVHAADLRLHAAIAANQVLAPWTWLIGPATFLVAGVYQFTSLKFACLDRCRAPLGFILAHWRGQRERLAALRIGLHHGLFCVGCCWSLMLLMFAVGIGSLGWMLALGAVMAAEKNLPWGRRLTAPLGLLLLSAGTALVLRHVTA
jgi:predicted metal-binding membrane protein